MAAGEGHAPYFPFYPRDFASDGKVEAMTTVEVGAYILLLCKAWHETPPATIPDDDRVLARWTRVTPDEWAAMKLAVLAPFKPCGDGRLIQGRLRGHYNDFRELSNRRASAGSKGGKAAAKLKQTHSPATASEQPIEDDSGSDPPDALTGIQDAGARVLWAEVYAIHAAYPKHRRGTKQAAMQYVGPVLAELRFLGMANAHDWLLARVKAYAASYVATNDDGKACVGLQKFCVEKVYNEDDGDWAKPGTGVDNADLITRSMALVREADKAKARAG
jgi:uncharacterized protein YdaU (DUF1376 family)